jgi:nucleotide-binding universal stress UspA family protein
MGIILCATRGGEASRRTQHEAIKIAKEHEDEIVFLYIIDLKFLDKTAAPIVVDIENELMQMGRFFLLMAQERAEENGVPSRIISRKGNVRDEIKNAAKEENATLVVLGRPAGKLSEFENASLEKFAAEIQEETSAEIVIV